SRATRSNSQPGHSCRTLAQQPRSKSPQATAKPKSSTSFSTPFLYLVVRCDGSHRKCCSVISVVSMRHRGTLVVCETESAGAPCLLLRPSNGLFLNRGQGLNA